MNPLVVAPEIREVIEQERIWEGLVGGWLPVVRFAYPVREGVTWEKVAFGVVDPPTRFIQPVWYRFLKLENGAVAEAHYYDSYLPYPFDDEPGPERFYADLFILHQTWSRLLEGAMQIDVPEAWIADFCRHAMVQEMITRVGNHPRYGILERNYGGPEHDGFQDILNTSVGCFLDWGLFDIAKGYLENYLEDFLRVDGSIDYRGPEFGQYARMLTNLAQYDDLTGDADLLLRYDQKIRSVARLLQERRDRAKQLPADNPGFGLIHGRHEADISFFTPSLATVSYEQPYFCNSAEAARGFRDLGRVWAAIGRTRDDPELTARGEALAREGDALREDLHRAIERSILRETDPPYVPMYAGSKTPFDRAQRHTPESFAVTRAWTETLHSGMVSRETVETILAYCAAHRGSKLGIFGGRQMVTAFLAYGEGYGLVQHDLIREFLLFYYGLATQMYTRGTWTALEGVDLDRDRGEHGPYCTPAQLSFPMVTRWMLVFEDPLSPTLWLARATPRAWLEPGKRIGVQGAPTRWGAVSYDVELDPDGKRVRASVTLPSRMAAETRLRLRLPTPNVIKEVRLNGEPWDGFDVAEETIILPADVGPRLDLEVDYGLRTEKVPSGD